MPFSGGRRWRASSVVAAVVALGLALTACTGGDDESSSTTRAPSSTQAADGAGGERPAGPAADLSERISGGEGVFVGSGNPGLIGPGYQEREYVAAGAATGYRAEGDLTGDGRWTFVPDAPADYRTRVIVRRPRDPDAFSGTVVVEWMNVSGGVDADPGFATLREEIVRQGHAWVGVSAQTIGVEGGPVVVRVNVPGAEDAGKGLKAIDPERYGSLSHPGDGFAFDIYTQVARALREGGGLGGLQPERVIAAGQSQSAFALVTYINGVQPLTRAFDGFFVHSRGASGLPLVTPGNAADIAGSIGGTPTILRTDTDVPVMELQTESDIAGVLNSADARQPDTDRFRLWEVVGTGHADLHLIGAETAKSIDCGIGINDGPLHVVGKAAFRHLDDWVRTGEAPPKMPRIDGAGAQIVRDPDGLARGGVRTPPVQVPTRVLSGAPGPSSEVICILLGSTTPMTSEQLASRYESRADFRRQYNVAVDGAIEDGIVLEEDRAAIQGYAHPELVTR